MQLPSKSLTSMTFKTLEHFEKYFHISKGCFLCIFHLFFESKIYKYRTFKGKTLLYFYPHTLNPRQSLIYFVSLQIRFPLSRILCKWNHTVYTILCLASLAQQNLFETHPCCQMYQQFVPFNLSRIPFCEYKMNNLFIHLLMDI